MTKLIELLSKNSALDLDVLEENEREGDVAQCSREVEFYFYASSEAIAKEVASYINQNQFASASFENSDGQYRILALINTPTTKNVLCSLSGLMACVGAMFAVEYDGWSSTIERGA